MRLAALGNIMQLAFVPADIEAATRHWTQVMGAGPFFRLDHVQLADVRYRGKPSDIDFSMRLGYFGDMQIELIEQHNYTPSIYKSWRDAGHDGLHHVCVLVDDIAVARAACEAVGARIAQEARVGDSGGVIYADTGGGPGTMVEYLQPGPGTAELFAFMREAHRNWDGSDPLRALG